MTTEHADLVIRAGAIHTLVRGQGPQRALAVSGDRVLALSPDAHGLDALIGPDTHVVDAPGSTLLPAFDDTHTHLVFAGFSARDVPVHTARDLAEFLDLIRERAAITPDGEWIRTTVNWQELNLAERRLPTTAELDGATDRHPVLVKRGGHNDVVNSYALNLAGITEQTPDPPGGTLERDESGHLTGRLIDNAMHLVERLYPAPDPAAMIEGLRLASRDYAASGIGTVRDAMVPLPLLDIFQAARDAGALSVRVRAMVSAIGLTSPDQVDVLLDGMEKWRGGDDPWLRVWGVKFGLDGGLEAGATEEPYADSHGHGADFCGMVLWEPDALEQAIERVVRRGWRVGTHAYGDRAVRILLDVYERVLANHPGLAPGTLVIEHAGLAGSVQRARAIALGVPVTVQHPLLHDTAEVETGYWGPARVEELFPVREWIDAGALVAAGSDFPVGPYGAMISVWGMVTRETVAGVRGAHHAVSRDEAIALHTVEAARLLDESETRGTLAPGHFADYTVWPADPLTVGIDQLRDLMPTQTVLGGRTVHTSTA